MKNIILIDVSNLAYRIHFTHATLRASTGKPTGVLHGVLSHILYLDKHFHKSKLIFCHDAGPTWRHTYYKQQYKSNREPSETRSLVAQQMSTLNKMINLLGFKSLRIQGLEADDIIAILAEYLKMKESVETVFIYSGDKDFYQLVGGKVKIIKGQGPQKYDILESNEIKELFGVSPRQWPFLRAMSGDKSDHIKPVKGIGKKTALVALNIGIDASQKRFKYHSSKVRKKLKHTSKALYPKIKNHWKSIHAAYEVSVLPRSIRNKRFTEEIKKELTQKVPDILKHPGRGEANMDAFVRLAAEYELEYILSKRHAFSQIS